MANPPVTDQQVAGRKGTSTERKGELIQRGMFTYQSEPPKSILLSKITTVYCTAGTS